MKRFGLGLAAVLLGVSGVRGETPGGQEVFVVSPMRVREVAGFTYFHATVETTMGKVGEAIGGPIKGIEAVHPGVPVTIMRGGGMEADKPVLVQVGVAVPKGTGAAAGFTVKALPVFKCAVVMYGGPMKSVGQAYSRAYKELFAAGLRPSGETRQMVVAYEGPDSPNNVVVVQVGVK